MFDESVFVFLSCITAKFGEVKNNLLNMFDVHFGHVEIFHINRAHRLTTRASVSVARTDHFPLFYQVSMLV